MLPVSLLAVQEELYLLPFLFGFRNDCRRVLSVDLFFEGWLRHVLCVVYNFSRRRLFCTGSGLMLPSFLM